MSRREKNIGVLSLLLLLIGFFPYLNALSGRFLWDEDSLIVGNPLIKDVNHLSRIFVGSFFQKVTAQGEPFGGYYRPMTVLSFAADHFFWGLNPFGYHLTSILLHLVNIILVFKLGRILLRNITAAALGALLFAIHPFQPETVTCIASRSDLTLTFFILTGLFLLRQGSLFLGLMCGLGALFSKESGLLFPLLAIFFVQRRHLPLFILGAIFSLSIYFFSRHIALGSMSWMAGWQEQHPPGAMAGAILLEYLRLWVIPWPFLFIYPLPLWSAGLGSIGNGLLTAVVVLFASYGLFTLRQNRKFFVCCSWFIIGMLPVLHVIPIAPPISVHNLYLPSIGLFLLIGWAVGRLLKTHWRRIVMGAFVLVCSSFIYMTILWNIHAEDRITFSEWVAASHERQHLILDEAYSNLALYLYEEGAIQQALAIAEHSRWSSSKEAKKAKDYVICLCQIALKKFDEAESAMKSLGDSASDPFVIYGTKNLIEEAKGNFSSTIYRLEEALQKHPPFILELGLRTHLGFLFLREGHNAEAIRELNWVLMRDPNNVELWHSLAVLAVLHGQRKSAHQILDRLVRYDPFDALSMADLGVLYYEEGNLTVARSFAERSLKISPRNPRVYYLRGLLYEVNGERKMAEQAWKQSLFLDPGYELAAAKLAAMKH